MMNVHFPSLRHHCLATSAAIICAALLLTACGDGKPTDPTAAATSGTSTTVIASATATMLTAGDLADWIGAAWSDVTSMRVVRGALPEGTPAAGSPTSITEIDSAGNKRLVVTNADGSTSELLAVNGVIWAKGVWPFPSASVGTPIAGGWSLIDPVATKKDQVAGPLIDSMLAPSLPLYSGLSDAQRQRAVEPLGTSTIDGRACDAYRIPATTSTGQSYDVIISLDANRLPCTIETIGLGQGVLETYTFNDEIKVVAPEATPDS
jgi:hypothetical protein